MLVGLSLSGGRRAPARRWWPTDRQLSWAPCQSAGIISAYWDVEAHCPVAIKRHPHRRGASRAGDENTIGSRAPGSTFLRSSSGGDIAPPRPLEADRPGRSLHTSTRGRAACRPFLDPDLLWYFVCRACSPSTPRPQVRSRYPGVGRAIWRDEGRCLMTASNVDYLGGQTADVRLNFSRGALQVPRVSPDLLGQRAPSVHKITRHRDVSRAGDRRPDVRRSLRGDLPFFAFALRD